MELHLFVTSIIPVIIIIPIFWYLIRQNNVTNEGIKALISGSTGWAIVGILTFIPHVFLYESSTQENFVKIFDINQDNNRFALFWIILFSAILSEIIRFSMIKNEKFIHPTVKNATIAGISWGVIEFISRFTLFFGDKKNDNLDLLVILFILVVFSNSTLTIIQLRSVENTKFVMFTTFLRFFVELSIFGAFGNNFNKSEIAEAFIFIISMEAIFIYLSLKTRKITDK